MKFLRRMATNISTGTVLAVVSCLAAVCLFVVGASVSLLQLIGVDAINAMNKASVGAKAVVT